VQELLPELHLSVILSSEEFTMAQVRASLILFSISCFIFFHKIKALCVPNCDCYENSKLITCKDTTEFPPVPHHGLFFTLVIFKSNIEEFSNLKRWTSLTKIVLKQTTYDCHFLSAVRNLDIDLEIDFNYCTKTREINLTTVTKNVITTKPILVQSQIVSLESNFTTTIPEMKPTIHQNSSNMLSTGKALSDKSKKSNSQLKFIIGSSTATLLVITLIICAVIYFWKKKVKVSRLPPNLPSGSQLDLADPSVSIEMDSFDSFDFQSSNQNIYEIPNPIYSNA
jgi:hypothetical protein